VGNLPIFIDELSELANTLTLESRASEPDIDAIPKVLAALDSFSECVRYLNTRRSKGAILTLNSEASVQDALYLMLRPWILDLIPENPGEKIANSFAIKDFTSKVNRFVLEAKYIRNKDHGRSIASEINDDIENYRYHPYCDDLIFYIYDPESLIPDSLALRAHVTSLRSYGDKVLRCHCVIKP